MTTKAAFLKSAFDYISPLFEIFKWILFMTIYHTIENPGISCIQPHFHLSSSLQALCFSYSWVFINVLILSGLEISFHPLSSIDPSKFCPGATFFREDFFNPHPIIYSPSHLDVPSLYFENNWRLSYCIFNCLLISFLTVSDILNISEVNILAKATGWVFFCNVTFSHWKIQFFFLKELKCGIIFWKFSFKPAIFSSLCCQIFLKKSTVRNKRDKHWINDSILQIKCL